MPALYIVYLCYVLACWCTITFCVKSYYILCHQIYYILRRKLLHFALLLHFVLVITFCGVTIISLAYDVQSFLLQSFESVSDVSAQADLKARVEEVYKMHFDYLGHLLCTKH